MIENVNRWTGGGAMTEDEGHNIFASTVVLSLITPVEMLANERRRKAAKTALTLC